jgi:class 3 adenylate cyclase/DNA-binding CsgD family transcriptional regulator
MSSLRIPSVGRPSGMVALLFTDLVGSTELLDRLGDDAAEELRRAHFALLRQALAETDGEEVKNLGDGLMVAFPSAIQAVQCAVAMQRAVSEHHRPNTTLHLQVRIGIDAGEPFREEGDFFGTAVVVAKRLCDQAEAGQILASEVVATLVGSRGGFRFQPVGRLRLKGLAQPLAAVTIQWEPATRARAAEQGTTEPRSHRRRAPRGPRLVGRDRELAVIEAELARASEGEFRCVLLLGDPGVGKTRLASEILARHGEEAVALSARAHPLGGTTSFGLWAEAFEGHLRGLDPGAVSALCGGLLDDLAALLRSAAAVRGSPPQGEPPRSRLLEGLAVLLANLAEVSLVVVLLDDVHVADASSWDALHYLARNLAESRVLVLATARPAELSGQAGPTQVLLGLEQEELLTRLELRPLPTGAVSELAGAVLGEAAPEALVGWLNERSRGNPLFTIGLVRALLDEGADLAAPRLRRLPETLAEQVAARLGTLDEPARSTLDLLAVVGRRVGLGDVAALSGRPLDRLGLLLDGLVRARFLTEEERGREVTYEITHPLIQEAIYEDLGAARRHALHRLVARSLLAAGRMGEAAPHFTRSAQVGDPEAIEALCGAVRQAEERELYRDALTILGTLVELLPPGDQRWLEVLDALVLQADWVVDNRADVYAALGIPALRAIDAALAASPDAGRRAAVKFRLANFLIWGTGDLDAARQSFREAGELFDVAGDGTGRGLAHLYLDIVREFEGETGALVEAGRRLAEEAQAGGDPFLAMQAAGRAMGWGNLWRGRLEEAEANCRHGAEMARADGKQFFYSMSLSGVAFTNAFRGRIKEALPLLEEAKAVNPGWRDSLQFEYEIMVHWLAGDFPAAVSLTNESLAWNAAGVSSRRAPGVAFGALSAAEAGRMDEAGRHLATARAAFGDRDFFWWSDCCRWVEALLAWRQHKRPGSLDALRRASDRMVAMEALPWATFVLLDLAEVATEADRADVAEEAATRLEEVAGRIDCGHYRGLARLGAAWAGLASETPERAAQAAGEAVDLLAATGWRALQGRALDVLGRALRPVDRPRAREALERAAATFDACGGVWRRDRALETLRRLGEAGRRSAAVLGSPSLTPREREVAELAARGQTAPEIARALFIGERTVESHLARIYAKLGVASKHDLLQRAAELGLADPKEPVEP